MSYRSSCLIVAGLAVAALSLQGCEQVKRGLGMEKVIPDEFAVVSRAPLAVPPDYALRPPEPGAPRTQETPIVDQARQNVFTAGDDKPKLPPPTEGRTPGESELLQEAGVSSAPADIRTLVNQEAEQQTKPLDQGFIDKLLFWHHEDQTAVAAQVVDPQKEVERLLQRKAAGLPPGQDTMPVKTAPAPATTQNASAAAPGKQPSAEGTPTIERTPSSSSFFGHLF